MTIWRKRIACWITKATNSHSVCVILIALPLQQWLQEGAGMLRSMYFIHCLSCLHSFQFFSTNHPCSSQIAPFIPTVTCRIRLLSPSLLLKDWDVSKAGSFPLVGERMGFGPKEWLLPVISHRSSYWASSNKWWHAVLDILDVSPFTIGHLSHELLFPACSSDRSQLEFTPPFRRSIASSKQSSSQNAI